MTLIYEPRRYEGLTLEQNGKPTADRRKSQVPGAALHAAQKTREDIMRVTETPRAKLMVALQKALHDHQNCISQTLQTRPSSTTGHTGDLQIVLDKPELRFDPEYAQQFDLTKIPEAVLDDVAARCERGEKISAVFVPGDTFATHGDQIIKNLGVDIKNAKSGSDTITFSHHSEAPHTPQGKRILFVAHNALSTKLTPEEARKKMQNGDQFIDEEEFLALMGGNIFRRVHQLNRGNTRLNNDFIALARETIKGGKVIEALPKEKICFPQYASTGRISKQQALVISLYQDTTAEATSNLLLSRSEAEESGEYSMIPVLHRVSIE